MSLFSPSALATVWRPAGLFAHVLARYAGKRGWGAVALVGGAALIDGANILLIIPILDTVVAGGHGSSRVRSVLEAVGLRGTLHQLVAMLAAFILLSILRAMTLYARDTALARLQTGFVEHQRNAVIRTLASASWNRVVALRHATVTNLLTTEIGRVSAGTNYLVQGSVALILLMVQGLLAFVLAPRLATAIGLLVLLGGGGVLLAQGRMRDLGASLVRGNTALVGSADGFLGGLKAATAQNAQGSFVAEFEALQADVRAQQTAFQRRQAAGRRVFSIGSGVAAAVVVLFGFLTHVAPAVLITLVLIFARMAGPAITVQQSAQNFFFALPSFEAMQRFQQDLLADRSDRPAVIAPPSGAIVARGLAWRHPGGGGVRNATLTIARGSFVGIGGPSGAGKTTLIDLLIGLLEPQAGTLSVGGAVLDAATRAGWRDTVAYVPQEGFLFHDTVRRNLAWGNGMVDDTALWEALALVGGEALVRRMPAGLDTVVGERGTLLSGGERQRLALARAILRRPQLLVLDEALNAIDAESETVLLARFAALDPRPTILMISHRPESLRGCDQVIRVEAGLVTAGVSG